MALSKWRAIAYDTTAIGIFALLARLAHNKRDGMELSFRGWLDTSWPFWLGVGIAWLVATAAKGDGTKVRSAGWYIWLIIVAVGLGIWGLRHSTVPHWSFVLVASTMSGLLLLGWRTIVNLVRR